ncbi:MAG: DUF5677 domain-containing protein [Steroidobacteraceae bacterium]
MPINAKIQKESRVHTSLGTAEALEDLSLYLLAQSIALRGTIGDATKGPGSRWVVASLLTNCIADSCESIYLLSRETKMRDSLVLARAIFETIVNVLFVLSKGDAIADKALRHALQKTHRDMARELSINSLKISLKWGGADNQLLSEKLEESLRDFTTKKGREITSWTPESLVERIEVIDLHFKGNTAALLGSTLLVVYRHASEIAHGTFFGAAFGLGMWQPDMPTSEEGQLARRRSYISGLSLLLGHCVNETIMAYATELPIDEQLRASSHARRMTNNMLRLDGKAADS